jgi:hypothetical protein
MEHTKLSTVLGIPAFRPALAEHVEMMVVEEAVARVGKKHLIVVEVHGQTLPPASLVHVLVQEIAQERIAEVMDVGVLVGLAMLLRFVMVILVHHVFMEEQETGKFYVQIIVY